jgi:hypothetical protein
MHVDFIFITYVCVSVYELCMWMGVPTDARNGISWSWSYRWLVSVVWLLGSESWTSIRAVFDPNHWAIEPLPFFFFFFGDIVSLCRPGWPGSCYVDQTDPNLQRSSSLYLPSAEIKGVWHCVQRLWIFFIMRKRIRTKKISHFCCFALR